VIDGDVAIRAGWAADGTIREMMSPGLAARVATADAEDTRAAERAAREHRARWEAAHGRAVDEAAWQLAREQGIPLGEARRSVGRTKAEALAYFSAVQDVEDARREAAEHQTMRRLMIGAGMLDVSDAGPSERAVEIAAEVAVRNAPAGEPFDAESVARGIRGRWLRRNYRRAE
jgi:hypothetical protein